MFQIGVKGLTSRVSYRWTALGSLAIGTFTVALSAGLLLPAKPVIMPEMGATITDIAWLTIAYAISSSALQPILCKQADLHGRKLFFVGGMAVFTLGAALASFSWDLFSMGVFRFIQGIGAAAVLPAGMACVGEYFPTYERGRAMGIWGMARGAAMAIGPVIGGSTLDLFGWRAIYQLSVVVGILSVVTALILLRESRSPSIGKQDYTGSIGLLLGVGALVLAVSKGGDWGWTSLPVIALFVTFMMLVGALVLVERRADDPVIDLDVVGSPTFLAASATILLLYTAYRGTLFLVPFFLMSSQGYTGSQVGLLLVPFFLPAVFAAPFGGWLADRIGIRVPVVSGVAFSAIGLGILAFLGPGVPYWHVAAAATILGLGIALASPPLGKAVIDVTPLPKLGAASGMFKLVRSKGAPIGVALFAAIFSARVEARGRDVLIGCWSGLGLEPSQLGQLQGLRQLAERGSGSLSSTQSALLERLGPRLQEAQDCAQSLAWAEGFNEAFLAAAATALLGILAAMSIRQPRLS